jgi:hypothetical protein
LAVAIMSAACIGRSNEPDTSAAERDSANGGFAHINGASLDSTSQPIRPALTPIAASSAPASAPASEWKCGSAGRSRGSRRGGYDAHDLDTQPDSEQREPYGCVADAG